MNKRELENIKVSALIACLLVIGMTTIMLSVDMIWFNATDREVLLVFFIAVIVSISVCLIPFTYAAHKLDKE